MSEIPKDVVTHQDLADWYVTKKQLSELKVKEMLMRTRIFRFFFPAPKEGTNTSTPLADGSGAVVKGQHIVNREVDKAALTVLQEQFVGAGIKVDDLIEWKPSLKISMYRELTDEQRHLFDQCLTVKDGSPQLEIVVPKRAARNG